MRPFVTCPQNELSAIRYILTDIDDTLTTGGRLPAVAYQSMEQLSKAGIIVIPVTGRPAGWCDHIARMWPVRAVVGENGAFFFSYDTHKKKMLRRYWKLETEREKDRIRLSDIRRHVLAKVPGCGISADQAYRDSDLAIDFCEDVAALPAVDIQKIVDIFKDYGATAKVSSIHVNGWFGDYDKLSMTSLLFKELFNEDVERVNREILFSGDSPNDQPMFRFFYQSVGVANILKFESELESKPRWITQATGGEGFSQMADQILAARNILK